MSEPPPTAWAVQLMATVQQQLQVVQQQQLLLQQRFEALALSVFPAPPLPAELSAEALGALSAHHFLADADSLYTQLLQLAFPKAMADEDLEVLRRCYAELRKRTMAAEHVTATPPSQAGHPSPADDSHTYVSRQGRRFVTRLPPPYPWRRCNTLHWSNTPCPQAHQGYQQNSWQGSGHPAPASTSTAGPHRSASAYR